MKMFTIILLIMSGLSVIAQGSRRHLYQLKKEGSSYSFYMYGESNSGAPALNSDATQAELLSTARVKIFDNVNKNALLDLDIGTNNLLGHRALEDYETTGHSFELQLSNRVKLNDLSSVVYLLKAGQGGSKAYQWLPPLGDNYGVNPSVNPWVEFNDRLAVFKTLIPKNSTPVIVLFLGINDAILGTSKSVFKNQVKLLIDESRIAIGSSPHVFYVHMPRVDASYSEIDDAITELGNENDYITDVSITGVTFEDINHFDYDGHKIIADRIIDDILSN